MSRLACPLNEQLYAKLYELKAHLAKIGDDHRAMNVRRIIAALIRFPFPIISGREAEVLLAGVGPWFASKIDDFIADIKLKRQRDFSEFEPPSKVRKVDYVPGSGAWFAVICSSFCSPSFSVEEFKTTLDETVAEHYMGSMKTSFTQELEALTANGIIVKEENGMLSLSSIGRNTAKELVARCPPHLKRQRDSEEQVPRPEFKPDSWFEGFVEDPSFPLLSLSQDQRVKDFSLTLVIDSVERLEDDFESIKNRLNWRGVSAIRNKLWIGDYHWLLTLNMQSGKESVHSFKVVVERKTANDLAASLTDGRYESQKFRLKNSKAHVIYLLEGTTPSASSRISEDTVLNALISTKFNFGFQVKVCKDTEDTCNWLMHITQELLVRASAMSLGQVLSLPTFEAFQTETNPNNSLNVQDLFGRQIRGLNKCGEQTTLAILQHYPTPQLLYRKLIETHTTPKRRKKHDHEEAGYLLAADHLLTEIKLANGSRVQKSARLAIATLFLE